MKRGEKKSGQIAVRLEPELMAELERIADAEERPLAAMARIILREGIAARQVNQSKKHRSGR
jgi:hypothetical protein